MTGRTHIHGEYNNNTITTIYLTTLSYKSTSALSKYEHASKQILREGQEETIDLLHSFTREVVIVGPLRSNFHYSKLLHHGEQFTQTWNCLRKSENGLFLFSLKQTPTDSQIDSDPFVTFKNIEKIKTLNLVRKDGLDYILCGKGFIILSTLSYIR